MNTQHITMSRLWIAIGDTVAATILSVVVALFAAVPAQAQTPVVTLSASDPSATELGLTTGAFTVTRSGASLASALTVSFAHSGTAGNNVDFVFIGSSVVIPAMQASATLTVTPFADNLVEINETVVLTLSAAAGYTIGSPSTATVTIADDPAIVALAASDATATEAGLSTGTFTLNRSGGDLAEQLVVSVVRGGSAGNNVDYAFGVNSIVLPAGQASVTQLVTPFADNVVEGNETVTLNLGASSSYTIGTPNAGTVTIADDPAIVNLVASDTSASEVGLDPGTFTFTRSGGDLGAQLTVSVIRGGTAGNNVDYAFGANSINIPAGQASTTQLVAPFADNLVEGTETVTLNLNPDSSFIAGASSAGTISIADDATVVTLTASDALADEAGESPGAFTFTRSGGDIASGLSVGLTRGGTAGNNIDYAFAANTVFIPAGQTTLVQPITPFADNRVEGDETVTAALISSSTFQIGNPNGGTVTIADDPAVVTIQLMDPIALERGADPGSFVVSRGGGDLSAGLSVDLTLSGTATNNIDYQFVGSAIQIPAGMGNVLVPVVPIFDLVIEGDETVILQLDASPNYVIDIPASATLPIVDHIEAIFSNEFE
jgi:hypothetical protein